MKRHITFILIALLFSSCGRRAQQAPSSLSGASHSAPSAVIVEIPERAIYFWKSVFKLNDYEKEFLKGHDITTLYIKMFDAAPDHDWNTGETGVFPVATTRFLSEVPEGLKVVPTVYITLEAMLRSAGKEEDLAEKIVTRVLAMASFNKLGPVKMVQFDCDWTASTRDSYFALCRRAREILGVKGILLSGTVRLHQVAEPEYPFDHRVLMLYNTGSIKNPDTRNSIIDYNEVKKYLKRGKCPHSFDMAYPTFGWTVNFKDGQFTGLTHGTDPDSLSYGPGETFRIETSEISEILKVKTLADRAAENPPHSNIIYHLDSTNLSKYTFDEIERIYSD